MYEDPTYHFIGNNTVYPHYQLHNQGDAMFSKYALSTTAVCSTYNGGTYPLAVVSDNNISPPKGIGVFSTGFSSTPNDELNIYADGNGIANFRFLDHNANFHSIISNKSYMGFNAADEAVVIKNDFATISAQPAAGTAKLYVEAQDGNDPDHNWAIWANNTNPTYSSGAPVAGLRAETNTSRSTFSNEVNMGVQAFASGAYWSNRAVDARSEGSSSTSQNYGGFFYAKNGWRNQAVSGEASGAVENNYGGSFLANGSTTNYGVKGTADGGAVNYGVYGNTGNTSGAANYGVYGKTVHNASLCVGGVGGVCTQAAGYFDGDVFVTNGTYITSDSTLKTNIMPFQNGIQLLKQLNAYTYNFDTTKTEDMNVPIGIQIGLFAQQVQGVLPGLVKGTVHPETRDSLGNIIHPSLSYLALNSIGLIPVLVGGIKEQQTLIDSLTLRLTNLEAIVNICCNIAPKGTGSNSLENNNQSIELRNVTTIFLDQNKPNPFSTQTDIDYYLPDEVLSAEMQFYDQTGQKIKSVSLKERGKGTLHVYSPDLKNGTYTYSLVADGKVIETKKMVKIK